jgi:hypothetical protein
LRNSREGSPLALRNVVEGAPNMNAHRKRSTSAVVAAALAAALVAASGPAFARQRASEPAYRPSQSRDIYQSNAQGHQSYSNPDRDYFSGLNTTNSD